MKQPSEGCGRLRMSFGQSTSCSHCRSSGLSGAGQEDVGAEECCAFQPHSCLSQSKYLGKPSVIGT